ncbi:MAG: preprotein translocase subunit SecG, partial [Candidatus Omnitrophica bacterium CG_4_10_14_0_8_um_filter_44_12]
MFTLIIIVHVLACCLLILIVLVQQGKGGGLIDSFSSAESIFGTKTNTFLVKATSFLSVVFFITCLSLAFLSIQRNKSLT